MRSCLAGLLLALALRAPGKDIEFAGYSWTVRTGGGGPGPNAWDANNVWLDAATNLHLKITRRDGKWSCAQVAMLKRLSFGRYEFQVTGRLAQLDDNVVLGLFNYPSGDVGPDGTHEIDIEFARWGKATNPLGNYTVWPVEKPLKQVSKSFPFTRAYEQTTHEFVWNREAIKFRSSQGHGKEGGQEIASWVYKPDEPARRIAQQPMAVYVNLWLYKGMPPKNGQDVEVIIHQFKFTPE